GDRRPLQAQERHRLLRPHPPGAPPHDRRDRAPLGEVADVPAAGAGLGAEEGADPVGSRRARQGARLPARDAARDRSGAAHRRAGGRPMNTNHSTAWRRAVLALASAITLSGCLTPSSSSSVDDPGEYGPPGPDEHVVHVSARRFAYEPSTI